MVIKKIILPTINDVKEFVNIMNMVPFNATIKTDRYAVDAKSIMGIFSLDLEKPVKLNLECEATDAEDTIKKLEKFIVE